jgi:Bifunctional DNA primase/polymerase, N-terminal/Primase C terminal 1 (PriCT-1)
MNAPLTPLDAALDYAARGLPVFPVYPIIEARGRFACKCLHTIRCDRPGKHPMTRHGLKDATTDAAVVRQRWYCAPDANIGIVCSANCCALDVDPRHGGDATLDGLEREHGPLPITWTAKTGGGGLHYFFRSVTDVRGSVGLLGAGLDIRGADNYVVAPPSRHISGNYYEWATGQAPGEVPLAIMPAWLLASKPSKPSAPVPASSWRALVCNGVSEGARNQNIARLAGHLLRRYVDPIVALEMLTAWNAMRFRPPLSDAEVQHIVNSISGREIKRRGAG